MWGGGGCINHLCRRGLNSRNIGGHRSHSCPNELETQKALKILASSSKKFSYLWTTALFVAKLQQWFRRRQFSAPALDQAYGTVSSVQCLPSTPTPMTSESPSLGGERCSSFHITTNSTSLSTQSHWTLFGLAGHGAVSQLSTVVKCSPLESRRDSEGSVSGWKARSGRSEARRRPALRREVPVDTEQTAAVNDGTSIRAMKVQTAEVHTLQE